MFFCDYYRNFEMEHDSRQNPGLCGPSGALALAGTSECRGAGSTIWHSLCPKKQVVVSLSVFGPSLCMYMTSLRSISSLFKSVIKFHCAGDEVETLIISQEVGKQVTVSERELP